jgi:hypothetical protein
MKPFFSMNRVWMSCADGRLTGNPMATARVKLTARDEDLFRAIDRCPLTVRQLRRLSCTFSIGFGSDRRLQDRLAQLTRAGLLRRFRYASSLGSGQFYYTLTAQSFYVIHGDDAVLPGPSAFREVSIARQHHTHCLSDFLTHTMLATKQAQATLSDFTRENALKLTIDGHDLFPDSSLTLTVPGRPSFLFYVELDNSTEVLASRGARESWIKKLRFYENLQNVTPTRFRVLGVVTRSVQRLHNLTSLAASIAVNKDRSVFLSVFLPDYLGADRPLTTPIFTDHRRLRVPLLPMTDPRSASGATIMRDIPPAKAIVDLVRT